MMKHKTRKCKTKSVKILAQRIYEKIREGSIDVDTVEHMLNSLVKNHTKRIGVLENKIIPRKFEITEKAVAGAIRDTIKAHGPITPTFIGSAAKRIYRNCLKVDS